MDRRKFIEMSVAAGTAAMLRPSEIFATDGPRRKRARAGLKRYLHAAGAGSFKLNVSPYGITADFYGGASETVSETFVLR